MEHFLQWWRHSAPGSKHPAVHKPVSLVKQRYLPHKLRLKSHSSRLTINQCMYCQSEQEDVILESTQNVSRVIGNSIVETDTIIQLYVKIFHIFDLPCDFSVESKKLTSHFTAIFPKNEAPGSFRHFSMFIFRNYPKPVWSHDIIPTWFHRLSIKPLFHSWVLFPAFKISHYCLIFPVGSSCH